MNDFINLAKCPFAKYAVDFEVGQQHRCTLLLVGHFDNLRRVMGYAVSDLILFSIEYMRYCKVVTLIAHMPYLQVDSFIRASLLSLVLRLQRGPPSLQPEFTLFIFAIKV